MVERSSQLADIVGMRVDGEDGVFDDAIEELDDADMDYDDSSDDDGGSPPPPVQPVIPADLSSLTASQALSLGPLMESLNLNPHLKNLLNRMLTKSVANRATVVDVLQHEWVTDEGTVY
jgi:serine/threonine protein kinase